MTSILHQTERARWPEGTPGCRGELLPRHTAPTSFGGLSKKTQGCRVAPGSGGGSRGRGRGSADGEPFLNPPWAARVVKDRLVVILLGELVQRDALCTAVHLDKARDAELLAGLHARPVPSFEGSGTFFAVGVGFLR